MAYDVYSDVKRIYDLKGQWDAANQSGDTAGTQRIAQEAQQYYKSLQDNGYADVANQLSKSTTAQTKAFFEAFSKPVVDVTAPPSAKADTAKSESIQNKVNSLYGTQEKDREYVKGKYDKAENYVYSNPYESEVGKSIMSMYKFNGERAGNNAIATEASSNNGNIDSYAAANAKRQQLAFTNAGTAAVLNDYNARVGNIRGILSDLGVYLQNQDKGQLDTIALEQTEAQRVFENNETAKNNDVSREAAKAAVTGFAPEDWLNESNPYLDENGNPIDADGVDYLQIIKNAAERLKTETDPTVRAALQKTIRDANNARNIKIRSNPSKYGQYANTIISTPGTKTADMEQFYEQLASAERITAANNASAEAQANAANKTQVDMNNSKIEAEKYMQSVDIAAEKELLQMQLDTSPSVSEEEAKSQIVQDLKTWVFTPVADADGQVSFRGYSGETEKAVYIACEKLSNKDMLTFIVESLHTAGFTDAKEIKQIITDLRNYVAKETLMAEGRADTTSDEAIKSVWNRPGYNWSEVDIVV